MPIGRLLIVVGIVCIVIGLIASYSGIFSYMKLGRLPGDIVFKRGNTSIYIPITTCLLLSVLFTLLLYLFRK